MNESHWLPVRSFDDREGGRRDPLPPPPSDTGTASTGSASTATASTGTASTGTASIGSTGTASTTPLPESPKPPSSANDARSPAGAAASFFRSPINFVAWNAVS